MSCGSLPSAAPLGQIWTAIPDLSDCALDTEEVEYNPPLRFLEEHRADQNVWKGSVRLPWPVGKGPDNDEIEAFLGNYPTLSECRRIEVDSNAIGTDGNGGYSPIVDQEVLDSMDRTGLLGWAEITFTAKRAYWPTCSYMDVDDLWLLPAMSDSRPLHPLLMWWAVLYALSMLARYEPASWINHLDVDVSSDAVALETVLDRALDACPQLVLRAIHSVAS